VDPYPFDGARVRKGSLSPEDYNTFPARYKGANPIHGPGQVWQEVFAPVQ
jgi:hypothetical protein